MPGHLTAATQLSTLNAGAGLPIRASDNDQLSVVNRDPTTGNPLAPASFDTGETAYDLKVIHPDDSVAYVDLTADATTMQDVLDAFNAVTGLSAVITNGELIITSSVAGTGDLRFEGVEIDNSTTQGNSGTVQDIYVDTSMLEALGLSDVAFSGASVTSSMGSGISALIDGTAGADTIVGSAGSDLLIAGSGADVVTGGAGKDHLILSTTGTAGDFVFTATTATVASALTATFSGVEIIEARGDSSAQAVDAAALTGEFIYRTGGGADTITKAAGKDTIIVERSSGTLTMPTINVDATAANNTNDQVFVELSGTFSGDLSSILTGITDQVTLGVLPERAEELRITRVDDSTTSDLTLAGGTTTYGSGVFTIKADSIHVQSNIVQLGSASDTDRLIFETTNFTQDRGHEDFVERRCVSLWAGPKTGGGPRASTKSRHLILTTHSAPQIAAPELQRSKAEISGSICAQANCPPKRYPPVMILRSHRSGTRSAPH